MNSETVRHELPVPQPALPTVSYESFVALFNQVQQLQNEINAIYKASTPEWLNRKQAMAYLQCSSTKLWELQNSLAVEHTFNGRTPLYRLSSCQEYLQSKAIDKKEISRRLTLLLSCKK